MRALRRALLFALFFACADGAVAQTASDTLRSAIARNDAGRTSYWIPSLEIPPFIVALNGAARVLYGDQMEDGRKVYSSTFKTTWEHLRKQNWAFDKDPFDVNQFRHPYLGATLFGFPRSTGHGFWGSLVYSNVGSFLWEMAGETGPPSTNDFITTSQAGSLLGEALYRIASHVLPNRPGDNGGFWTGLLADVIYPPRGFNRRLFGNNFQTNLSDTTPAVSWQLRLGATMEALKRDTDDPARSLQRDATVEYSMTYGLPGKPGYDYRHPLSYFDLQVSALFDRKNPLENVTLRGFLFGTKSGERANSRGIWGLYGSYDYFAPYLFRVSSSALSLGTTRQDWLSSNLALQTSILGGVGYGAAGTTAIQPTTPTEAIVRDYHYGVTPQGLVTLRLIAGNRVMIDVATRGYYVSGLGSDDTRGSETIFRHQAGLTLRINEGHALNARFVSTTRAAKYGTLPDNKLSEKTVTVAYSLLGSNRFGAVRWR